MLRGRFIILGEALELYRNDRNRGAVAEAYCRANFPSGYENGRRAGKRDGLFRS